MRLVTSLHAQLKSITTKNINSMDQTAVEFLWNRLFEIKKTIPFDEQTKAILNAYHEAIEKEKEQIVQAFNHGRNVGSVGSPNVDGNYYYKQIFKSE